jgi:tetratricopeptide (TPR) repeat protein
VTTAPNANPGASQIVARYVLPALLGLLCLAVFLPAASFEFTNLDDNVYVVDNPALAKGLSGEGVRWAFTTRHGDLWMPATWLTYLADHQFGGGTPGAFHRTNIALHVASTLLLYFLLRRLAGAVWRPALVAALFAIHPLHVESVAWVAERKDVLSGFFFLLALLPHAKPDVTALSPRARLFSLLCFALALMSKPMVVTLPVVLLLLDFRQPGQRPALRRLLVEKLPYLVLAAAVSVITWQLVQTRDIGGPAPLSLPVRLAQAIGYCALYLARAVWPTGLSVSYPPEGLLFSPAQVALAAGALAAVSWLAWRGRNQRRLVWLGWLWFLVMLLPVLDLVQGGMQLMSDRYFYLPSIGLFMAAAWLAGEAAGRRARLRLPIAAVAVAAVAVLGWVAHRQVQVWRDSRTLFSHAVAVNDADYLSHLNLGKALEAEGRLAEALPHLQRAATLHAAPLYLVNLADVLRKLERHEQAVAAYREAVRLQPEFPSARNNLGNSLVAVGDWAGAEEQFLIAVRQDPAYADAHCNLGLVRLRQGRADEAAACFRRALQLEPGHPRATALLARLAQPTGMK